MFDGYIVAVVSPFQNNQLDLKSFEQYIKWLVGTGISGVVVGGSTGESLSLTLEEYTSLIRLSSEIIDKRIKLIGGVISSSTDYCLSLINSVKKYVDGFLCICPFYIKPTQKQIVSHFQRISKKTSKPIVLYNNPSRVGTSIDEQAFYELSQIDNIVAIKECSSDLSRFSLWRKNIKKDFDFLSGNDDSACGALAMGASGVISVSANIYPKLCVKVYNLFKEGNIYDFEKYRDMLAPLHKLMFSEPSPAPIKYALSKIGLMSEEVRAPLSIISSSLKAKIDSYMNMISNNNV